VETSNWPTNSSTTTSNPKQSSPLRQDFCDKLINKKNTTQLKDPLRNVKKIRKLWALCAWTFLLLTEYHKCFLETFWTNFDAVCK
jgi:hypothetical protein